MTPESKTLSLWDTARFYALITLPAVLTGLVAPNRFFASRSAQHDWGRWAVRLVMELRRKYGCDHLWLWFPVARTLLVLDGESIDDVLGSTANAADPWLKKAALARFVPEALVISSGAAWQDRRRFNESVLSFGHPPPAGAVFKDIAFDAVAQWSAERGPRLRWEDFRLLALRIAHQVVFGADQVLPAMDGQLARMASASNVLFKRPRDFAAFYGQIDAHIEHHRRRLDGSRRGAAAGDTDSATACLLHDAARLLAQGSASSLTQVPSQIGFWLFVLKDALELHVARTLALLAAHAPIQARVRAEINQAALSAEALDALPLLDACIREQLRLWTPVPLLLRRAVRDFAVRGVPIAAGQQVMMLAGVYHRDPHVFGARADRFVPEAVAGGAPPVYVFSAGPQSCAGQFVAMFMLKATLAALLRRFTFQLIGPQLHADRIPYAYDYFNLELRAHGTGATS